MHIHIIFIRAFKHGIPFSQSECKSWDLKSNRLRRSYFHDFVETFLFRGAHCSFSTQNILLLLLFAHAVFSAIPDYFFHLASTCSFFMWDAPSFSYINMTLTKGKNEKKEQWAQVPSSNWLVRAQNFMHACARIIFVLLIRDITDHVTLLLTLLLKYYMDKM